MLVAPRDVVETLPGAAPGAPVVFDSPHSGSRYPPDFGHCVAPHRLRTMEDAFVDTLFADSVTHGATLVRALWPRSYIDPNRAPDDIDESLLEGRWPGVARPGPKVALGIGLVARQDTAGPLYDRRLPVAELRHRLDRYYWPYHHALEAAIDRAHADFGACWHVNCHSMKSVSAGGPGEGPGLRRVDVCVGDRDGTTSEAGFTALVAATLGDLGYRVSVNDPYKGVELVRRYSDPAAGRHSVQIEINRALYLDERRVAPHEGFEALRADLGRLAAVVCEYARDTTARGEAAE